MFVLQANSNIDADYLHYVVANDKFIGFVMNGAKGVKMPRGDKNQMKLILCLYLQLKNNVKYRGSYLF